MKHKLENIIKKYNAITDQLADPTVISNLNQLKDLAKEYSQIEPIVKIGKEYINILPSARLGRTRAVWGRVRRST